MANINFLANLCRLAVFMVIFLFCLYVLPARADISEDQAVQNLNEKIDVVKERRDALNDLYYSANAPATLAKAFRQKGVKYAARYADSWGSSIWVSWSYAAVFYAAHENILHDSINAVQQQGLADAEGYNALETGMNRWKEAEKELRKMLENLTSLYADLGALTDREQKVGEESRGLKCGYGEAPENIGRCKLLKQDIKAAKQEFDRQTSDISSQKDELHVHSRKIQFAALTASGDTAEDCPDGGAPEESARGQRAYVMSNNARIVNRKRNLGARTVAFLRLNDRLEVIEGRIADAGWVKVRTSDGQEGYIRGSALRHEPLDGVPGDMRPNERRFTEQCGTSAKG